MRSRVRGRRVPFNRDYIGRLSVSSYVTQSAPTGTVIIKISYSDVIVIISIMLYIDMLELIILGSFFFFVVLRLFLWYWNTWWHALHERELNVIHLFVSFSLLSHLQHHIYILLLIILALPRTKCRWCRVRRLFREVTNILSPTEHTPWCTFTLPNTTWC